MNSESVGNVGRSVVRRFISFHLLQTTTSGADYVTWRHHLPTCLPNRRPTRPTTKYAYEKNPLGLSYGENHFNAQEIALFRVYFAGGIKRRRRLSAILK